MSEKIATRNAFGNALVALAEKHPELVVLDADLSHATMTAGFASAYPDRFFNMGIAECNMVGVAAGLATCGKKPFLASFAMFSAGRAFEQVRNSVAYPGLPVVVAGSHGGLSVGEDGATHQCCEDLGIMRTIPGMTICCPCDGAEMTAAVEALLQHDGPAYLRLGRAPVETVTSEIPGYKFQLGKGVTMVEGSDVTIIAVGMMVQKSLEAAKILKEQGISAKIINMHCIKPLDEALVLQSAKETGCIVCTEEHNIMGGLGDAVSGYLSGVFPVPVIRHGVEDQFGRSGKAEKVLEYYGLTTEKLVEKAKLAISMKK